jgi:hypothetical protein
MKRYFCWAALSPSRPLCNRHRRTPRIWASRPLPVPLMCHARLIGPAAPVGVGAAAAAAAFLRLLRRAVAAAVGAVAVGVASNGAAAVGTAAVGVATAGVAATGVAVVGMAVVAVGMAVVAVGMAVVGVVGNLRIKKADCRTGV